MRVMINILVILSFFLIDSSFANEDKVIIDPINGIYEVKNILVNNSSIFLFAVCKESNKVEVSLRLLSDKERINKKEFIDKYQSHRSGNFIGIMDENRSMKAQDEMNFLIFYFRVAKNKVLVSQFLGENDFYTSFVGEKVKDEFNIIDFDTNKIIEICKSK